MHVRLERLRLLGGREVPGAQDERIPCIRQFHPPHPAAGIASVGQPADQDQRAGDQGTPGGGPLAPVLRPARRPFRLDEVRAAERVAARLSAAGLPEPRSSADGAPTLQEVLGMDLWLDLASS